MLNSSEIKLHYLVHVIKGLPNLTFGFQSIISSCNQNKFHTIKVSTCGGIFRKKVWGLKHKIHILSSFLKPHFLWRPFKIHRNIKRDMSTGFVEKGKRELIWTATS